ncbi:hypothetical protein RHGRI_033950 [Rhododendron griersonianum]|uniref:DUF659 domain-containing protein n=1 Tax=Rhododendron griersonianum TaxID=479676 RepID=A0AAV6HZH8_9ERIC|nr:hypothetical protein RHGRI_033950 [Rhododendron griersonianum]
MMGQQTISATFLKARIEKVDSFLAQWVYEAGIPFYAIDNNSFAQFCEAVGQFGVGYQPPSQYKLREPLLKAEVERTKKCLKKQEQEWASTGCSIMTDAWSDRKRRSIMNLCVNCKEGTTFLYSKETSDESHTGEYIFNYVDNLAEKKEALKVMVTSDEWGKSKWGPSSSKGKTPYATVLSISFWNGVSLCLKVFAPLVKVLRLVDGDRPSMGFVYGELQKAKQEIIEACMFKEAQYKPIFDIIDVSAEKPNGI